ncbi:deoxynucleoside kinase-like [Condylostylus longicornis]|uniref:deoxynucleoside kinase-like n=1 Tax=Condylostylus longicornis TaxID=2530218 RepID=UPI00244DB850|nr:deoxynucleoside kinase-like [Condylostylus longicornis]
MPVPSYVITEPIIEEHVPQELQNVRRAIEDIKRRTFLNPNEPFTIIIEGNIGSGKSTLIRTLFSENEAWRYYEPLFEVGGANILQRYYEDKIAYDHLFHERVLISLGQIAVMRVRKPFKIIERSIYSTFNIFANLLQAEGHLTAPQYDNLHYLYKFLDALVELRKPHLIIYIRSNPRKCLERIRARRREGEEQIDLAYLQNLNDLYEAWLMTREQYRGMKILQIQKTEDFNGAQEDFGEEEAEEIEKEEEEEQEEEDQEENKENNPNLQNNIL